ncbi:MAG: MBL fold metallo-hydrolase [Candidatus Wallbacteria bacterium]|nr:MBL fold metallo-hydrolase [Candidatus Wallbacteria bacterium]
MTTALSAPVIWWVNNASFVFCHEEVRLLADPWLFGTVFADSWELLVESKFRAEDFDQVSHIWFSHDHPDHFSVPTLSAIPEEKRPRLPVLYQKTLDGKVVRRCRDLGFQVRELDPANSTPLGRSVRISCGPVDLLDSWLLVEAGGFRVLNLNDCVVQTRERAAAVACLTGPVDVVISQFSYANWMSNPEDVEGRIRAADECLETIRLCCELFSPRWYIPSSAFIKFSHAENVYMNDEMVRLSSLAEFVSRDCGVTPVVLAPDDRWIVGTTWDNAGAIRLYDSALDRPPARLHRGSPVTLEELVGLSRLHLHRLHGKCAFGVLRLAPLLSLGRYLPTTTLHVRDLGVFLSFDVNRGLRTIPEPSEGPDISLSSDSLARALQYEWGDHDLFASGRFSVSPTRPLRFFDAFRLNAYTNAGYRIDYPFVLRWLLGRGPTRAKRGDRVA